MVTREQVRVENEELRKWQKRVSTVQAWRRYSARKPEKLRRRSSWNGPHALREDGAPIRPPGGSWGSGRSSAPRRAG